MRHLLILLLAAACSAELKLQLVTRKVNLNSQFAKVSESIKVKNTGSQAVQSLVLCQQLLTFQMIVQLKIIMKLSYSRPSFMCDSQPNCLQRLTYRSQASTSSSSNTAPAAGEAGGMMDIGSKAGYYTSKSPKLHLLEVGCAVVPV